METEFLTLEKLKEEVDKLVKVNKDGRIVLQFIDEDGKVVQAGKCIGAGFNEDGTLYLANRSYYGLTPYWRGEKYQFEN